MILEKLNKVCDFAIRNEENITKIYDYFKRYGYLDDSEFSIESLIDIIKRFQRISGIVESGIINAKTITALSWPRCRNADKLVQTEFASSLSKWGIHELNYYIAGYDSEISLTEWIDSFQEAGDRITNVCNMKFRQVKNIQSANIIVGAGAGRKYDFDGSGGTLAWAQLPNNSNFRGQLEMMFDLGETWIPKDKKGRGIYLVNVACHELLHILGLGHSDVRTALAAPFYSPDVDRPQQNDDIPRLVARYGQPTNSNPTPIPVPTPNPIPQPVPDGNIDEYIIRLNGKISIDGYRLQKIDG